MGKRFIGERTCMGCGEKRAKPELLRFVWRPNGRLHLDLFQIEKGRGGYLCPREACFHLAARKRRLSSRFRKEVKEEFSSLLKHVLDRVAEESQSAGCMPGVTERPGKAAGAGSRPAFKAMKFYFEYISGGSSGWPK